jgi:hypothetical protein
LPPAVAGHVAAGGKFDVAFFKNYGLGFTAPWKQHNAALKWFRRTQEDFECPDDYADLLFSNDDYAAVAGIIKGKGMSYDFDESVSKKWHWFELVAQLDDHSIEYVVEGPDQKSDSLRECWLSMLPGTYDHKRHHQLKEEGKPYQLEQLRVWNFLFVRSDGSTVRLHPQWSKTVVDVVADNKYEVEIPYSGLGESDGRGTYRCYRELHVMKKVRFDSEKVPDHLRWKGKKGKQKGTSSTQQQFQ